MKSNLFSQLSQSKGSQRGASVDSRLLTPGDLYFALPGDRVDGHQFIEQAAAQGACAAVVHNSYRAESFGLQLIHVDDVLDSLQTLAAERLAARQCRVVAITGSHGKTTTKSFLATLLSSKYSVASTPASYNGQIGLPLSILKAKGDEDVLVLEMGMSQKGELAKLVQIAPPDIAILLNVAHAHLSFFNSLEEIAQAKSEIFSHPKTAVAIVNKELERLVLNSERITFSTKDPTANFFASLLKENVHAYSMQKELFQTRFPVPGAFNLQNYLAAVIAAHLLGMSFEEITHASASLSLPARRFQQIEKNGILFIDDAYNAASPMAVCAALHSLPSNPRRFAVLGGMLELGEFSEEAHTQVAKEALDSVEYLFCFGKECLPMVDVWEKARREVHYFEALEELAVVLESQLQKGDLVLIKGSRGCAMENLLTALGIK